MQALILAGGRGTRLQPYTTVLPKPLMPVGDYPILEIILRQLSYAGVKKVILAVGYLGHLFQTVFSDGNRYGLEITYSLEERTLGTAGPISLAMDRLDDDFLIMNGDLLTTLNYKALFSYHQQMQAAATITLFRRNLQIDFGVIETNHENKLARYEEKPAIHLDVSAGINVMNKKIVSRYVKPAEPLDIPELMNRLVQDGHPVFCYREECRWLDIGHVEDYRAANELFESNKNEFLPQTAFEDQNSE